jgi:biotin operon repressor
VPLAVNGVPGSIGVMGRDDNPVVRTIQLLRLLARAPASASELAGALDVAVDAIKKDIRALKSAGVTVESKMIRGEPWYWVDDRPLARFLGLRLRFGRAGSLPRAS